MEEEALSFLTAEELEYDKRFKQCSTIEELQKLADETNLLYENNTQIQYRKIDMTIEEFKEKYGLVDINDLKGKYGF